MLMLKTTHDRIVEAKVTEIAADHQLIAVLETEIKTLRLRLAGQVAQNIRLYARLAPFVAKRPRGAGGKFLSTKGAVA